MKEILQRIENKKETYIQYNFSQLESSTLMTFFDLAQEFERLEDFYYLCVAVLKVFLNLDARLYIFDSKSTKAILISSTIPQEKEGSLQVNEEFISDYDQIFRTVHGSLVIGLKANKILVDQTPEKVKNGLLGYIEIFPSYDLSQAQEFFLQKYANRIGFNLHNRFLFEKNVEHLKFIRSLVADIEHNVIVPNIVFKLFLRRLKVKIEKSREVEKFLIKHTSEDICDGACLQHLFDELHDVNRGLKEEFDNIEKHYKNTSLFLETLLRRSHFDHGRLMLRKVSCNMKRDIIYPQLERFADQFKEAGIYIDDKLSGIPDEEIISVVDIGLIAQVYANFFSNALKYTEEVIDSEGQKRKYISYGKEIIKDFFGEGKDGIKYNVFSTGSHIKVEERDKIFNEGFRGSNASSKPGTGHGLSFVKNAIEIHGGVVGYEATNLGNNFYFVLPR